MPLLRNSVLIWIALWAPQTLPSENTLTVSGLVVACKRAEKDWIGFCNGYIQAAVDLLAQDKGAVCIPPGTSRNAIYDAVMPMLENSDKGVTNALVGMVSAIASSFKCK